MKTSLIFILLWQLVVINEQIAVKLHEYSKPIKMVGLGWEFDSWSGEVPSFDNSAKIIMDEDKSLVATFIMEQAVTEYYVATSGNDDNPGTKSSPFKTIQKGYSVLNPGEKVFVMSGTYSERLILNGNSGSKDNMITVEGLDNSNKPIITGGIYSENCSYLHFKGFEVSNTQIRAQGSEFNNNIFENLDVHHIVDYPWGDLQGFSIWGASHDNLILNCDFHDNVAHYGSNADGFGFSTPSNSTGGPHDNTVRFCRSYYNNDDGFDTWWSGANNRFEGCWSFANGYDKDFNVVAGDGNGFKLGQGKYNKPVVTNCLAFANRKTGFDENANQAGGILVYNSTAFDNGKNFDFWSDPQDVIRNCVAVYNVDGSMNGADDQYNNWNLGITADESQFISLDYSVNIGPRQPDGSLPESDFLKLKSESDLIDKGIDVGISFNGSAPDLGAYEYGVSLSTEDIGENQYKLSNYPNPLNDITNINYRIDKDSSVKLIVYNVSGQEVEVLVDERQAAGNYSVEWDASKMQSGIYFYKFKVGPYSITNKMLLVK